MEKDSVIGRDTVGNALRWLWTKCKATFATKAVATQSANGLMSSGDKAKLDGLARPRVYYNAQVAASAWGSGSSEVGGVWTRWANIPLDGMTEGKYVQVVFNPNDVANCNMAGMCVSRNGYVSIFCETAPGYTITIPTIIAWDA